MQTERTCLAWSRTALSAAGVAALLIKSALSTHHPADIAAAIAAALAALIMQRVPASIRTQNGQRVESLSARRWRHAAVGALVCAAAVLVATSVTAA